MKDIVVNCISTSISSLRNNSRLIGCFTAWLFPSGMANKGEKQPLSSNGKTFWAGGFGGMCAVITGHPFDTIKVRLQTMPLSRSGRIPTYRGAIDCACKTVTNEGIRGFYKGMLTPLVGSVPLFAVCFLGFNVGKDIFARDINKIR